MNPKIEEAKRLLTDRNCSSCHWFVNATMEGLPKNLSDKTVCELYNTPVNKVPTCARWTVLGL